MTRGNRVYTPKATQDEERRIAEWYDGPEFPGAMGARVTYSREGQLIELYAMPDGYYTPLTGDTDNYLKLTLDALQRAGAFANDRQVVQVAGAKE